MSTTRACPQAFAARFFCTGSVKSFDMNTATHRAEEGGGGKQEGSLPQTQKLLQLEEQLNATTEEPVVSHIFNLCIRKQPQVRGTLQGKATRAYCTTSSKP